MIKNIFALTLLAFSACTKSKNFVSVISSPSAVKDQKSEVFILNHATSLLYSSALEETASFFQEMFLRKLGRKLSTESKNKNFMRLELIGDGAGSNASEGYQLTITPDSIVISAQSEKGLKYGLATLFSLGPATMWANWQGHNSQEVSFPVLTIDDAPRFNWRGFMLDVSRHFYPKAQILEILDMLYLHKINIFHFHLTDSPGWRIEIEKYPKLTSVGAYLPGPFPGTYTTSTRSDAHWGYYTKDDLREIVTYATKRNIEVVPEIDLPGHSGAIIASYPQYGCFANGEKHTDFPVTSFRQVMNNEEATFEFIKDLFTEIIPLFPSQYVHIGGDEVDFTCWKQQGLEPHETMRNYIARIKEIIETIGQSIDSPKKIIAWDDIQDIEITDLRNTTIMGWRNLNSSVTKPLDAGFPTVATPNMRLYLDHHQGPMEKEPAGFYGITSLKHIFIYRSEYIDTLTATQMAKFLGVQASMWTEYVSDYKHLQYMIYPRISALAEIGWSASNTTLENFMAKIPLQLKRYKAAGVNYSTSYVRFNYHRNL